MSTLHTCGNERLSLEVLIATMKQEDFSLENQMCLKKSAVIANQTNRWEYAEKRTSSGVIRMISTQTKGVGINRNLALQLSTADILLFSDDDVTYYEGALDKVEQAFRNLPEADVIFFGMDMTQNGVVVEKHRDHVKRVHIWNSLKYGTCRMAVRREAVVANRLAFSTLFGGGCMYSCGEDTIFICDCYRAGLRAYAHDCVLGECASDESSWFSGYTDKYFFDRGAMIACAFPKWKGVIKYYYGLKFSRLAGRSFISAMKLVNAGIKAFATLTPYHEQ